MAGMFLIESRNVEIALVDQTSIDAIISQLESKGYRPILRSIARSIANTAYMGSFSVGVDLFRRDPYWVGGIDDREVLIGDLFVLSERIFLLSIPSNKFAFSFAPKNTNLIVTEIRRPDQESGINEFCLLLTDCLISVDRLANQKRELLVWKSVSEIRDTNTISPIRTATATNDFDLDQLVSEEAKYSELEVIASNVLKHKDCWELARTISTLYGKKHWTEYKIDSQDLLLNQLLIASLAKKECVCVCRKTHKILTVYDSYDCTIPIHLGKLQCAHCSRLYCDELLVNRYILSDLGASLLQNSKWMTIWISEILRSSGIDLSSMRWGAEGGEDEVDIVLHLFNKIIAFELKDRDFGLGDADKFVARCNRYSVQEGVIVTTTQITPEAKRYLATYPGRVYITTIEGQEDVSLQLKQRVQFWFVRHIQDIISINFPTVTLNLREIAWRWAYSNPI
jgi:hypothetical protein